MNMLLKLYSNFKNNIFKYYNTSFIISIMVSTLMDILVNINRAKYLPSTWLAFLFYPMFHKQKHSEKARSKGTKKKKRSKTTDLVIMVG